MSAKCVCGATIQHNYTSPTNTEEPIRLEGGLSDLRIWTSKRLLPNFAPNKDGGGDISGVSCAVYWFKAAPGLHTWTLEGKTDARSAQLFPESPAESGRWSEKRQKKSTNGGRSGTKFVLDMKKHRTKEQKEATEIQKSSTAGVFWWRNLRCSRFRWKTNECSESRWEEVELNRHWIDWFACFLSSVGWNLRYIVIFS